VKQHIFEELSTSSIDWDASVIMGHMMPPRDLDEDGDEEDDEDEEEEGEEEPPIVREPDED
jgi:hypothetical protein